MNKLVLLALILLIATPILAHPPEEISGTYDPDSQMLTITILHKVADPLDHYIKEVVVARSGKTILEQKFNSQFSDQEQVVIMMLPNLKEEIELRVQASCNKSGKNAAAITVKPTLDSEVNEFQTEWQEEEQKLKQEQIYEELP